MDVEVQVLFSAPQCFNTPLDPLQNTVKTTSNLIVDMQFIAIDIQLSRLIKFPPNTRPPGIPQN